MASCCLIFLDAVSTNGSLLCNNDFLNSSNQRVMRIREEQSLVTAFILHRIAKIS